MMRGLAMFMFSPKVTFDRAFYKKLKEYSEISGYSSVEEFVVHVLEKEIEKLGDADSKEMIKKRLKGLGYIS